MSRSNGITFLAALPLGGSDQGQSVPIGQLSRAERDVSRIKRACRITREPDNLTRDET